MPSEEPRDRYNAPLAGAPQLLVNQWDKVLEEEEAIHIPGAVRS